MPSGHPAHTFALTYSVAAHAVAVVPPHVCPRGHPLHPEEALESWNWPEGQPLQPLWVLWSWYWPPGHAWHDVWPWLLLPM